MPEPQNFQGTSSIQSHVHLLKITKFLDTWEHSGRQQKAHSAGCVCPAGRAAARAWAQPGSPTEGSSAAGPGQSHSDCHLQSRQSWQWTSDCSRSKWQSSPKEPLEIAISLLAHSIHVNHGSEHAPVLKSQLPGPGCIQDKITKGFFSL